MDNVIARNKEEVERYREKIFKAKDEYHKQQAKLPFEKKIEIVVRLNNFVKDFKKSLKIVKGKKKIRE